MLGLTQLGMLLTIRKHQIIDGITLRDQCRVHLGIGSHEQVWTTVRRMIERGFIYKNDMNDIKYLKTEENEKEIAEAVAVCKYALSMY